MTEDLLAASHRLHEELLVVFAGSAPYLGDRFSVAMDACGIAIEHASAVLCLAEAGLPTSAAALLRVQFEALTRAMWLLYVATDAEVSLMLGPLDADTQKAASKLPSVTHMLRALETAGPAVAIRPLLQFKDISVGPMNSFVHSGLHPLQRQRQGFPRQLLDQLVRSSNGLNTMSGMLGAILAGDTSRVAEVKTIQARFLAVLPPLAPE
jgi:hypothetical protein